MKRQIQDQKPDSPEAPFFLPCPPEGPRFSPLEGRYGSRLGTCVGLRCRHRFLGVVLAIEMTPATCGSSRDVRDHCDNGEDGRGWLSTCFWVWFVLELEYFLGGVTC